MGNNTMRCCVTNNTANHSECKVPQGNNDISPTKATAPSTIPKLPTFSNVSSIFEFILSADYYNLLIEKLSPFNLINKFTSSLNQSDLVILISKLVDWIHICEAKNNDYIKKAKIDIELGTKKLIAELKGNKYSNNGMRINMCMAIGEVSMIAQYIKYSHEVKKNNKEYKENYWKDKNVERWIKLTVYNCIYYMVKAKESERSQSVKNTNSSESVSDGNNSQAQIQKIINSVDLFISKIGDKMLIECK